MAKRRSDTGEWLTTAVEAGTAPWVLAASSVIFLLLSILSSVPGATQYIKDNFATLILAGFSELLIVLYVIRQKTVKLAEFAQTLRNESVLLKPPASINGELLDVVEEIDGGSIFLICYGSNRFGKVLDTVMTEHNDTKVNLIIADPSIALHSSDADAISELLEDCASVDNITVYKSRVLPTIRAALVYDRRGKPYWASVSPYLIHKHSRAMKSESIAPVFRARRSDAQSLDILASFVSKEFTRLKGFAD